MSIARIVSLLGIGMLLSSCSIYMAANQPGRKDLAVLTEGMAQAAVQAELGNPAWSGKDSQGFDIEIFQFVQGYSGGARAARALWHTAADTFSLGLWELIGFPIESHHSGTKMNVIVTYDEQQRVKSVKLRDDQNNEIPLEAKSEEETQ
jgi:outer membrane protein assembly factor BamE (lipoprotein component of BamABCDE complex)